MRFLPLFCGLLGLLIGSFLNVVIYRVPRGESIAFPGSHCPACGYSIPPGELIPVLSFLLLKGRCRRCHVPISWRYPVIELLSGILFYYTVRQEGDFSVQTVFKLIFISFLIALAFIDLDTFRLPDALVLPLWAAGMVQGLFFPAQGDRLAGVIGMFAAGGSFWLITKIYPRGLGFGDVKLAAALGAFLGFPRVFLAIFLASLAGSILGSLTLWQKGRGFKQQIPFGPYLALGSVLTMCWGDRIIAAYWQWMMH